MDKPFEVRALYPLVLDGPFATRAEAERAWEEHNLTGVDCSVFDRRRDDDRTPNELERDTRIAELETALRRLVEALSLEGLSKQSCGSAKAVAAYRAAKEALDAKS